MENNEYEKLKEFWNQALNSQEVYKVEGKFVESPFFNGVLKEYVKSGSKVLDYGCGSGWLLGELFYTVEGFEGVGIDPASDCIKNNNEVARFNNFNNLQFINGDENTLSNYPQYFDVAFSINVIDVLPEEVAVKILMALSKCIKKDGFLIIGINPGIPKEYLLKNGFVIKNKKLYKNDILRGIQKTADEWYAFFSQYFEVYGYNHFYLVDGEKKMPRRMFILKNKVKDYE